MRSRVHYIEDVRSRLLLFDLDGKPLGEVALPARGSIDSLSARRARRHARVHVQLVLLSAGAVPLRRAHARTDARVPGRARSRPVGVRARSGTACRPRTARRSTSTTCTRPGCARDGSNPVLRLRLRRLRCFAVAAVHAQRAVLHRARRRVRGRQPARRRRRRRGLASRRHVRATSRTCSRTSKPWCAGSRSSGISRPERIAITGGSNGGLLVGALITRAPDAFRAAAALRRPLRHAALHAVSAGAALDQRVRRSARARRRALSVRLLAVSPRDGGHALSGRADRDRRSRHARALRALDQVRRAPARSPGRRPTRSTSTWSTSRATATARRSTRSSQRYARMYAFIEHELGMGKSRTRPVDRGAVTRPRPTRRAESPGPTTCRARRRIALRAARSLQSPWFTTRSTLSRRDRRRRPSGPASAPGCRACARCRSR